MLVSQHVAKILESAGVLKSHTLLIAVSGGMDSMLLWDTLRLLDYTTIAVHVNYNLRGQESVNDEAFVRAYADKNELKLYVFQADPKTFESNLQEEARVFRYAKFESVKTETNADWVLTAHHFNDDVETFFLNLIRGAGLQGLKGIAVKRDYYVRPFLDIPKKVLEEYARANTLQWREDASNQTQKYLRNKIRHAILPSVLESDSRAEIGIQNSLDLLKKQNSVFNLLISKYRKEHITFKNGTGVLEISDELVKNAQLLYEVLLPYGQFQVEQILASRTESGKVFVSKDYSVYLDRGNLLIIKNNRNNTICEDVNSNDKKDDQGILSFDQTNVLPESFHFSDETAVLDFDVLKFPLTLRNWRQGDSFQPFGMKGRKKLSDFLIDKKVPLPLKQKVLVLTSEEEIIWVVGFRIDDRFKVTSKTKKIYLANLLK